MAEVGIGEMRRDLTVIDDSIVVVSAAVADSLGDIGTAVGNGGAVGIVDYWKICHTGTAVGTYSGIVVLALAAAASDLCGGIACTQLILHGHICIHSWVEHGAAVADSFL